MERLHTLVSRLLECPDRESALNEVLDAVIEITGADMGKVQTFSPDRNELSLVASRGFSAGFVDRFRTMNIEDGMSSARALLTGERVLIEDVSKDPAYADVLDVYSAEGCLAVQSTPLIGRGGVRLGVLSTHYRLAHAPTEWEQRILDLYTRQAADFLENQAATAALAESEARYRLLFENLDEGFCVVEVLFNETGEPVDYRFVEVNRAFTSESGIDNPVGRRILEIAPDYNRRWLEIYGSVCRTGEPVRFEMEAEHLNGRFFDVSAFRTGRPDQNLVAILFEEATEQRRAAAELRQLNSTLLEANRRKDQFLATLAHELRNPLAAMQYALALVDDDDPADAAEAREVVDRQFHQLVRLVDDLMDISRISSGKIKLRRYPVVLSDVIQDALESAAPVLTELGHRVEVTLPDEPVRLFADGSRLTQVFANLISNAAKYSDPSTPIALWAVPDSGGVVVHVRDQGIGMDADQLRRVFDMFSQAEEALDRTRGGLGIGLYIVKAIVELHGGGVEARSAGRGKGTQFTVFLPEAAPLSGEGQPAAPADPVRDVASRRILVVDDNRDSAGMLSIMLRRRGHTVRVEHDGHAALDAAESWKPDLVLLDIGLPGLNGYDVARLIRQARPSPRPFLAAMTGWGQEDDKRRARECGFDLHMTKPVRQADLEHVLEQSGEPTPSEG
jgi:signal transduction histidine kinase/ActR/RegA family two-component response regulator